MVKIFKENGFENENNVYNALLTHKQGATITELTELSNIPRSAVRIQLARLEGANKVTVRKIGMAKVYILNQELTQHQTRPNIYSNAIGGTNE